MTRGMQWLAGALVALLVLTLAFWVLRHHDRRDDARERAYHDSLVVLNTQAQQWRKVATERSELYREASSLLDSVLRVPQKIVYVPVRRTIQQGEPVDTASPPDSVPYVPLQSFTELSDACRQEQSACQLALDAKDSLLAKESAKSEASDTLRSIAVRQLARERTRGKLRSIRDVGIGGAIVALWCTFVGCGK